MALNDILLTVTSYPEPTPITVIEDAVAVASVLGAHIAALACEVHIQVPGHFITGSAVGLPGVIAGEAGKSRRHARVHCGEMQLVRAHGAFGRVRAASRSHDHAGIRSMVRRERDLRIR